MCSTMPRKVLWRTSSRLSRYDGARLSVTQVQELRVEYVAPITRLGEMFKRWSGPAFGIFQILSRSQLDTKSGHPVKRGCHDADDRRRMSRFPVTVGEYSRFMRDGGYENTQWCATRDAGDEGLRAPFRNRILGRSRGAAQRSYFRRQLV